jgi:hypothetical protein
MSHIHSYKTHPNIPSHLYLPSADTHKEQDIYNFVASFFAAYPSAIVLFLPGEIPFSLESSLRKKEPTLIKKKIKFYSNIMKFRGIGCKVIYCMTSSLVLTYGENICAFPGILGSPSSYMTLHPIPSEYPYI